MFSFAPSHRPAGSSHRHAEGSPSADANRVPVTRPGDATARAADVLAERAIATPAPRWPRLRPSQGWGVARVAGAAVVPSAGGRPLEPAVLARMESSFGHDFSRVRVHSGDEASAMAQRTQALAYTVGQDIVFAAGQYAPRTPAGKRILAHELAHVVQQSPGLADWSAAAEDITLSDRADRFECEADMAAERVISGRRVRDLISTKAPTVRWPASRLLIQRSNGLTQGAPPVPPAWLGSFSAGAIHVQGDIWDIKVPSLRGDTWVGPYDQLSIFINKQGYGGQLEAAHIIGREHLSDISSGYPGDKAPCVAVPKELHATWTKMTTDLQKQQLGGRTTKSTGRPVVTAKDVEGLYNDLYSAHPELREFAHNIVNAPSGGMPEPTSTMPKPTSPMDAHPGTTMPKPTSPMDAHPGTTMPKPTSPMDAHPGTTMPKPTSPMDAPTGGWRGTLSGLKSGFSQGVRDSLKGLFSPEGIAAEIPGVVLTIADKIAARDAIRRIEVHFSKAGFAKGVAAGAMGWYPEEVSLNLMNRMTPFRVQDFPDPAGILSLYYILQLAETYENQAVFLGYQFSASRSLEWKNEMRGKGYATLAKYGYNFRNEQALFEYDFIERLAWTLSPYTDPIVDDAIEKGDERREAREAKQHRFETGHGLMLP
jgi:Domain of unknown function (DUF4157)